MHRGIDEQLGVLGSIRRMSYSTLNFSLAADALGDGTGTEVSWYSQDPSTVKRLSAGKINLPTHATRSAFLAGCAEWHGQRLIFVFWSVQSGSEARLLCFLARLPWPRIPNWR